MTCKQINCPLRIKCGVAHGEVKGKRTVYIGYKDGKCNEFKKLKEVKK